MLHATMTTTDMFPDRAYRVLLVEDDDGDALLVEELLRDIDGTMPLLRARSLAEATPHLANVDCVLVDLGLPDAFGLAAVERLKACAPDAALVVLTGNNDRQRGLAALAGGAQDYLVKGEVDGEALFRSIRYAVERRQAELVRLRLLLAEHRQSENDRMSRGLLPRLELGAHGVRAATRYQPGGRDALLGGDFFDAIERPDGSVRAIIGDVCGHGPDEAALGVALRIAWRTGVLLDATDDSVLVGVDAVLRHQRHEEGLFATVCDLTIDPSGRTCTVRLHGHPPPLVVSPTVGWMPTAQPSPPLGIAEFRPAASATVELDPDWAMLLMTDGVYEARRAEGRLGMESFVTIAARIDGWASDPTAALDTLVRTVSGGHPSGLDDDVALVWLGCVR